MEILSLKNEFYDCIADALKNFQTSAENKHIYAIVFDCDSSTGSVILRYRNKSSFESEVSRYEEDQQSFGLAVYGLHGSEYEPGEFDIIEYQKTKNVKHFMDSYYYHETGCYYGDGEPIHEMKDNYKEILWDMVICTINRLKMEIENLGIHTTDDFIIFHCDHDQSYEERDRMICMTVDRETIKRIGY